MVKILPILVDIRSIYNVGSILRTCDGLGIKEIVTVGLTPHLPTPSETQLPHVTKRLKNQLSKTALGAENTVLSRHFSEIKAAIKYCRANDMAVVALENTATATDIQNYTPTMSIGLLLGSELDGLSNECLMLSDLSISIAMRGQKTSLNVSIAAAIAMYQLSNYKHL